MGWSQVFSSCSRKSVIHKVLFLLLCLQFPVLLQQTEQMSLREKTVNVCSASWVLGGKEPVTRISSEQGVRHIYQTFEDKTFSHKIMVRRFQVLTQLPLLWLNKCPYTDDLSRDFFPSREVSPLGYKAVDQPFPVRKLQSSVCSYLMIERKGTF